MVSNQSGVNVPNYDDFDIDEHLIPDIVPYEPVPKRRKKPRTSTTTVFSDASVPIEIRNRLQIDAESGEFIMNATDASVAMVIDEIPTKGRGRKAKKVVDNLMGQANVALAANHTNEALDYLHEAVRQDPRWPDAYLQMSHVYNEQHNNPSRAFEYRLLAAHLDTRTTAPDWADLGELAVTLERIEEAAACYGNAVRCEPSRWLYYEKRIELLEALGLTRFAMKIRLHAAQAIDVEASGLDFDSMQVLIKTAAEYFIDTLDEEKAMESLKIFLLRCHEFKRPADVQHIALINMLMGRERYEECVKSILAICSGLQVVDYSGNNAMKISVNTGGWSVKPFLPNTIVHYEVAPSFSTLILGKLIICLLNLQNTSAIESLIYVLLKRAIHDAEEEQLLIDIGRTYHTAEMFDDGVAYMQKLLALDNFTNNAEALLVAGTLEHGRDHHDKAICLYGRVLELSPTNVTARINLSSILQLKGEIDDALQVLMNADLDASAQLPDERLLIRQADVLYGQKSQEPFIRCVRMLLVPHFYAIYKEQNFTKRSRLRTNQCCTVYKQMLIELRGSAIESQIKRQGAIAHAEKRPIDRLTLNQLHDYCLHGIETLFTLGRWREALEFVCLSNLQPRLCGSTYTTFMDLTLLTSIKAEAYTLAFEYLRYMHTLLVNKPPIAEQSILDAYANRLYNAMNFVFSQHQNIAYHRFIMRAEDRLPDCIDLKTIAGNNSLVTGSYRHALSEYLNAWSNNREDPLLTLLIALTFTHIACKKDISGRHILAMRGLAFMDIYKGLRGEGLSQEVHYNTGRLLHQLGMFSAAVQMYEKVLNEDLPPRIMNVDSETGAQSSSVASHYDMRPSAAHNLAHIYEASGNYVMARAVLEEHCTL